MRRPRIHIYASLTLMVLVVPMAYNSCQAGLIGGRGFNAAQFGQCKPVLYKGEVQKLSDFAPAAENPFASGKVQLKTSSSFSVQSKTEENIQLNAGTSLSFIADNSCLQQERATLDTTVLSKAAADSATLRTELSTQAYLWTLDRDYTESEIGAIANNEPCVVGVSWNHTYKIQAFNDTGRFNQTHLNAIRADESYPYFYNNGGGMNRSSGSPVVIAVIDTGIDWQHPDISGNLWRHTQGIGIDITTIGGVVNYNPFDVSGIGHGTHVAGLISAVTDNAIGVSGAMPFRAQIMAIKVFAADANGNLSTTSQHFYNAVQFAYVNGAQVINLSLGSTTNGPSTDALADSAITEAVQRGVVVITVIGNADSGSGREVNGTTLTTIPGVYSNRPGVIGVGSFDTQTGLKSGFSHYSVIYAEVGAPGADLGTTGIYSTLPRALSSYGRLPGTSQAAPLVAAAAGLTIGLIKEAYNVAPSPQEVERLILASAEKSAQLAPFFKDGNRLDLLRLVQRINADYPATQSGQSLDLSSVGCQ